MATLSVAVGDVKVSTSIDNPPSPQNDNVSLKIHAAAPSSASSAPIASPTATTAMAPKGSAAPGGEFKDEGTLTLC
jgi:hypothetical protein